jgi:hypothetical protein
MPFKGYRVTMYMKCITNLILDLALILEDWRKRTCTHNLGSFTLIHTNIISYSYDYAVSDLKTSIKSFFTDLVEIVKVRRHSRPDESQPVVLHNLSIVCMGEKLLLDHVGPLKGC